MSAASNRNSGEVTPIAGLGAPCAVIFPGAAGSASPWPHTCRPLPIDIDTGAPDCCEWQLWVGVSRPVSAAAHINSHAVRAAGALDTISASMSAFTRRIISLRVYAPAACRYSSVWRSLSALPITDTELSVMAALAQIGLIRRPVTG